ncbi:MULTISPECIES: DUF4381 family protein [Serratia]|uniref:DUF4381 domain-containing protein n=1 Tax=Serratia quinivorans TaxID=137545 RepID=A0A380D9N7_9GAMM|nr:MULTISPECIES: DUF4381 family protein [Serratia]RYM66388.1 hypothetical protein BSR03_00035 [Serratia proteamaculans]CAI2031807.1 Uncharacterised protein [Serratia quinivorans]SUJ85037.1 Uncharacterised protein [Serratia quinivorans]
MLAKGFSVPDLQHPALPAAIPWLPLPPGWIVLGALLLAAFLVWICLRLLRWRRNRWRREARCHIRQEQNIDGWLAVIKRILLVHRPRQQISAIENPEQLLAGVPLDDQIRLNLISRYCHHDNRLEPEQNARLQQQLSRWLETLPDV